MTLEELIKTLEGAQEKATEGVWHRHEDHHRTDVVHIGCPGERGFIAADVRLDDAQAIADRHNTASMVLDELKRHRDLQGASGFWGRAAAKATTERNGWKVRAKSAEAEVERLKASKEDPTP